MLTGMVIGMLSTPIVAQETTTSPTSRQLMSTIQCDADKQKVFDIVMKKHGEEILGSGDLLLREATKGMFHRAEMLLTLNIESGSWSIIGVFPDGTGCLVTSGTKFKPYTAPKEKL